MKGLGMKADSILWPSELWHCEFVESELLKASSNKIKI
jgi:hypothetical protein